MLAMMRTRTDTEDERAEHLRKFSEEIGKLREEKKRATSRSSGNGAAPFAGPAGAEFLEGRYLDKCISLTASSSSNYMVWPGAASPATWFLTKASGIRIMLPEPSVGFSSGSPIDLRVT